MVYVEFFCLGLVFSLVFGACVLDNLIVFPTIYFFRMNNPSLKNCQLAVTSVEKRQQEGMEFLFF